MSVKVICENLTRPGSFISLFVSVRRFQLLFLVLSDSAERLSRGNVTHGRCVCGERGGQEKQSGQRVWTTGTRRRQ